MKKKKKEGHKYQSINPLKKQNNKLMIKNKIMRRKLRHQIMRVMKC